MASSEGHPGPLTWWCQVEGCTSAATVRHDGLTYCGTHGLVELARLGVVKVQRAIEPLAEALESATEPTLQVS